MNRKIVQITLVVDDYDRAIQFYTERLNFFLIEDTPLSETKRWVRIAPDASGSFCLLLAQAANEVQKSRIGDQTGGRVFLFMHTDDFWRDFQAMQEKGIQFVNEPRLEVYGTVAVFEDLYGNLWDLIQPNQ